jgi:hypothetical protein
MLAQHSAAAQRWFAAGFALGAAGALVASRKGRPRLTAMVEHWRAGIAAGRFARNMFCGLHRSKQWPPK